MIMNVECKLVDLMFDPEQSKIISYYKLEMEYEDYSEKFEIVHSSKNCWTLKKDDINFSVKGIHDVVKVAFTFLDIDLLKNRKVSDKEFHDIVNKIHDEKSKLNDEAKKLVWGSDIVNRDEPMY